MILLFIFIAICFGLVLYGIINAHNLTSELKVLSGICLSILGAFSMLFILMADDKVNNKQPTEASVYEPVTEPLYRLKPKQ